MTFPTFSTWTVALSNLAALNSKEFISFDILAFGPEVNMLNLVISSVASLIKWWRSNQGLIFLIGPVGFSSSLDEVPIQYNRGPASCLRPPLLIYR